MIALLHLLIQSIDPYLDIKSFQDDKLLNLMKKFGYPVRISKTRMMALGSSHTYPYSMYGSLTQTLHLLKWMQSLGEFINTTQDNVVDESMDDIIERAILKEYRDNTFNSNAVKNLIENQ